MTTKLEFNAGGRWTEIKSIDHAALHSGFKEPPPLVPANQIVKVTLKELVPLNVGGKVRVEHRGHNWEFDITSVEWSAGPANGQICELGIANAREIV